MANKKASDIARVSGGGIAGQVIWLPDLDSSNPISTPFGYLPLSKTTTTTITNAQNLYPTLWARYTSTNSGSPIYRSGSDLIVQKFRQQKRTKRIPFSVSGPTIQSALAEFEETDTYWTMDFHIQAQQSLGGSMTLQISGVTPYMTHAGMFQPIYAATDHYGGAPRNTNTMYIYTTGGFQIFISADNVFDNCGISAKAPLSAEPTWASFPGGYQSYAANALIPPQTAFIRLFD